ncbi:bacillithiol biosynthesis cysteine-adding enzyme BshC [Flavobacterium enshiense]|uniref:bacillithiol biosynthesis cysteine-adding enzyme BshC n=1 Tax=Flavobacterium enshiense TaxID=1341165 RepID=UPI00345C9FC2
MPTDCISYQNSGYFSKLIVDYLNQEKEVQSFYHRFPTLENFKFQIEEKAANFSPENRKTLVTALKEQYNGFEISEATRQHIALLEDDNTFTITTGHQLNLFTGPLYFIYKIVSTINLVKQLKSAYPDYNFVPVYWMATEDHDFEEISYFYFKNKKIHWNRESFGPVGRLSTEGLDEVFEVFSKELGIGNNADHLRELFRKTYLEHSNLANATRFLVNKLFNEEGLVIVDGDDVSLKKLFVSFVKQEITEQLSFKKVSETLKQFEKYEIQVNPREINLFYIEDNLRERIVFENGKFQVNNTKISFTESELLSEIENHPNKISPNVLLRPLYQEIVLPNLCYIGGGGEIAYWLELKSMFEAHQVTFPVLLLRNSVLLATEKQIKKTDALNLSWADLFSKQTELINRKTAEYSEHTLDFSEQKAFLKVQFEKLNQIATQTDKSFSGAVKAQETKQLKGLENLEKRLLKAEKKTHQDRLSRIVEIQNELFPNHSLQERKCNFSEYFVTNETNLTKKILALLNPLSSEFYIIPLQ